MTAEALSGLSSLRAPTSEDIDALARAAFERLPITYTLDQNLTLYIFRRTREVTPSERDAFEALFDHINN